MELLNCINHKNVKNIIIYGNVSRLLKDKLKITRNIYLCYEFNKAINTAIKLSSYGDLVLLSPGFSSFDQFKNYKERGNTFKKIIRQYGLKYVE